MRYDIIMILKFLNPKAVDHRCSRKWLLLNISQNSRENDCTGLSFLVKLLGGGRHTCFPVNFTKCSIENLLMNTSIKLIS